MDGTEAELTANDISFVERAVTLPQGQGSRLKTWDFYNQTMELPLNRNISIAFLVDPTAPSDAVYLSTSLGVETSCMPITRECRLNASDTGLTYTCLDGKLSGWPPLNLSMLPLYGVNEVAVPDSQGLTPFLWTAAVTIPTHGGLPPDWANSVDSLVISRNETLVVLVCTSTVSRLLYSGADGGYTLTSFTTVTKDSPDPISPKVVFDAISPGDLPGWSGFVTRLLSSKLSESLLTTTSVQNLADEFSVLFSKVAVSSVVGIMDHSPSPLGLKRQITLVPKVPFVLLVTGSVAYILLGLLLGTSAVAVYLFRPAVGNVQAQLNERGLYRAQFDQIGMAMM